MSDRTSTTSCTRPAPTAGTTASTLEILTDALELYPVDGLFFNMFGNPSTDYSGRSVGPCQCERAGPGSTRDTDARCPRPAVTGITALSCPIQRAVAGSFDGLHLRLNGSEFGLDWNVMSLKLDGDGAYVNATDPPIWERPTPDTDLLIHGEGAGSVLRGTSPLLLPSSGLSITAPPSIERRAVSASVRYRESAANRTIIDPGSRRNDSPHESLDGRRGSRGWCTCSLWIPAGREG